MTNPTLERAARAAAAVDDVHSDWDELSERTRADYVAMARAVLMAVLPTLERYEVEGGSENGGGYAWVEEEKSETGDWVRYDDLQAILNDGEGE